MLENITEKKSFHGCIFAKVFLCYYSPRFNVSFPALTLSSFRVSIPLLFFSQHFFRMSRFTKILSIFFFPLVKIGIVSCFVVFPEKKIAFRDRTECQKNCFIKLHALKFCLRLEWQFFNVSVCFGKICVVKSFNIIGKQGQIYFGWFYFKNRNISAPVFKTTVLFKLIKTIYILQDTTSRTSYFNLRF